MTAPGNNFLQIALALAFVIACGYASGRIHQWYRHGMERDSAYREGYNHASHSMFDMALRVRAKQPVCAETPPRSRIAVVGADAVGESRRRIVSRDLDRATTASATVSAGRRRRHAA